MELKRNDAGAPLWKVEQGRTVHTSFEVHFDEPVDADVLRRALDRTLDIYPIITYSVVMKNGVSMLAANPEQVPILHHTVCFAPGSKVLKGHGISVIYNGDMFRFTISHVITDGGGIFRFARTLVYFYCCMHDGIEYDPGDIAVSPFPEEAQDADFWNLDYGDIPEAETAEYERTGFVLPAVSRKQPTSSSKARPNRQPSGREKKNIRCVLSVPESDFMRIVKSNNTSPSVMAFLLFAKAIYTCHEEAGTEPVVGRITVDARRALGIPDTMRNCSLAAHLSVRNEELTMSELPGSAARLRQSLKKQTGDALLFLAKQISENRSFPMDVKPTVSISYMGKLDFGACGVHIRSVRLFEGEFHKLNICVFRSQFRFIFLTGDYSERYARAVSDILTEMGIKAVVSGNEILEDEAHDGWENE